ncbi:MAG: hypothetical protein NDJ90_14190 [Oligoflexia bacterium]|nr:hypothetical protein [Oligoflexia bacterium]
MWKSKKWILITALSLNGALALAYDARPGYSSSYGQPDPSIGCESYAMIAERQQREVDQFERLVLAPMHTERDRLNRDLSREINRPREIEEGNRIRAKKIAGLEADNLRREQVIAQEEEQIAKSLQDAAAADAAGKPQQAKQLRARAKALETSVATRRKNTAAANAEISRLHAVSEEVERERQEILTTPPSATELQDALREVESKILNAADLKNEKIMDVRLSTNARDLCMSYGELDRQYQDLRVRYDELFNRCVPAR